MKARQTRSRIVSSLAVVVAMLFSPILAPTPAVAVGEPMTLTYELPNWYPVVELELRGTVNASIDWGDGTVDNATYASRYSHTFGTPGVHTVSITGTVTQFGNSWNWTYSNVFMQSVGSFGDLGLTSLDGAFIHAGVLSSVPATLPSTVTNLSNTFNDSGSLGSNISLWNTSNVTNMGATFRENRNFNTSIENWDTSSVTNMEQMFYYAENFNQDVSSWNVSAVTNMAYMFAVDRAFDQDISTWDVSAVTTMSYMFVGSNFNHNIGTWDTSNVTYMNSMFESTPYFNQPIGNWNVSQVLSFAHMFHNASAFNQPLNNWNVSAATNFEAVFQNTAAFNQPLNLWNVSSAVVMSCLFCDAQVFNQDLNNWNVSNVQYFNYTFLRARDFNGNISTWNTSSAITMESMFAGAQSFNSSINNWNVSNVTNFYHTFEGTSAFNQPLNNWNPASAITMEGMFWSAHAFDQDISTWDVSSVTNMRHMFRSTDVYNHSIQAWTPSSVTSMHAMFFDAHAYDQAMVEDSTPGGWTTASVTDMSYMFSYTHVFDHPIASWNVSNVTDMSHMFEGSYVYNQPMVASGSNWDTSSVVNMWSMFNNAQSFNQNISSWNTASVQYMAEMFRDTPVYNQPLVSSPGHWNTSNVVTMQLMFYHSMVFNQDLDTWDTGNVENFSQMFSQSVAFNGSINSWDMHSARYLTEMFNSAQAFNQPLNNWNFVVAEQMHYMFFNAPLFNQPLSNWNTSTVVYMNAMFSHAVSFNQDISNWDVSNVQYFGEMFYDAQVFNQDLTGWVTTSALSMNGMFNGALVFDGDVSNFDLNGVNNVAFMFANSFFNQPIGNWDMGTVSSFDGMFYNNGQFDQDISQWDVHSATNMSAMFQNSVFNHPIDDWDVSNVYYMNWMFTNNQHFNQPIYKWNTNNAHEMYGTFYGATAFNQDISQWNISQVYYLNEFLVNSGISIDHYSRFLVKVSDTTVHSYRTLQASSLRKCSTEAARQHLVDLTVDGGLQWYVWDWGVDSCKDDQTLSFTQPDDFAVNKSRTLVASATSTLPVTFKWLSGPCEIDGDVVTATGEGRCAIAANQVGDDTYYDATQVVRWLNVVAAADPDVVYNANGATNGSAPVDNGNPHATGSSVTLLTKGSLALTNALFTGWNTKADGTGVHYDEGEVVTMPYRDLVLYAEWLSLVPHMVAYDANGADGGTAPLGSTYVQFATVTVAGHGDLSKNHYHFAGWNTEHDGTGTPYSSGDTFTMGANAVTLYAQWDIDTQYSVTYHGNGNSGGSAPTDANVYFAGDEFEVSDHGSLTKEHEHFIGWTENINGTGTLIQPGDTFTVGSSGNIHLYAQWEVDGQHSITYDDNGADSGTDPDDANRYYEGDSATILGKGDLYKHGFTFQEWNTAPDGGGDSYSPGEVISHPNADLVLYAIWSADPTYTLSYSTSGSTSGDAPESQTSYEGDFLNVAACELVRTGYTCDGWTSQPNGAGQTYETGDHFVLGTSNATLYPLWTPIPTSVVTLVGNGSTSAPVGNHTYNVGDSFTLPTASEVTRDGYTLIGWTLDTAGLGTPYQPGAQVTVMNGDISYYALWQAISTPTVVKKSLAIKFWPYESILSGNNKKALRAFVKSYLKGHTQGLTITVVGYVQHSAKGKVLPTPVIKANLKLQNARAKAVVAYLKRLGIKVRYVIKVAESNSTKSIYRRATVVAVWR